MSTLSISDFSAFFSEVHGHKHKPFLWQQDLLDQVVRDRSWPNVLDLPTGSGKTACIDIALFTLAMSVTDSQPAWCPRRIVMIVDRRVVVDQAVRRASRIVRALAQQPSNTVTAEVARRLASLSSESIPLRVATLRGGMPRDRGWARTPDQPLVIASTVDQFGSRLLFRGYGVSQWMSPVHAGLLGNDCLVLLDEVHLSQPFEQTLCAVSELRKTGYPAGALKVVSLSATPGGDRENTFKLSETQKNEERLAIRLMASKPATLHLCEGREALVTEAVERAIGFLNAGHQAIAVVVNRVASAHLIAKKIVERLGASPQADVHLLTGRMRPLDRDDRIKELEPRIGAIENRRKENGATRPLIIVATQCIEAGADFDFDALITEHASLDALRQRFGRLDRLCEYGRAQACIIAVQKFDRERKKWEIPKDDPIYGETLVLTWKELTKRAKASKPRRDKSHADEAASPPLVDFGVNNFSAKLAEADVTPLLSPKLRAPLLFPVYLHLWAQTCPQPPVTPYLPLFLHGPQAGPADLQIVWRTDLNDEECWESEEDSPSAIDRVAALPPSSLEAVQVPFVIGKRWLLEQKPIAEQIADVDRPLPLEDNGIGENIERNVRAIVWRGDNSFVLNIHSANELHPGDTVVVPTIKGGLFMGSFDPFQTQSVQDIAERASFEARSKAVLRLHSQVLADLRLVHSDDGVRLSEGIQIPWLSQFVTALENATVIQVDNSLKLIKARRPISRPVGDSYLTDSGGEDITDPEASSFNGRAVKLRQHSTDVERWARSFCDRLGLSRSESSRLLAEAIFFAAWLHDVGKADPRFQCLLRGGSEVTMLKDQRREPSGWLLAKSEMDENDFRRRRIAAVRSGYPRGKRHEILSLAMIQNNTEVRAEAKRRGLDDLHLELALHLVASHHGWCRPFPPVSIEPDSTLQVSCDHENLQLSAKAADGLHSLDSGIAERFARLNEHFGPLQLAWFESVLRLADHRASEEEANNGGT